MEPQTEQDLTDRLHPIHVVHEVSLPQVDGELREEELLLVSLKLSLLFRASAKCHTCTVLKEDSPFHWGWLS